MKKRVETGGLCAGLRSCSAPLGCWSGLRTRCCSARLSTPPEISACRSSSSAGLSWRSSQRGGVVSGGGGGGGGVDQDGPRGQHLDRPERRTGYSSPGTRDPLVRVRARADGARVQRTTARGAPPRRADLDDAYRQSRIDVVLGRPTTRGLRAARARVLLHRRRRRTNDVRPFVAEHGQILSRLHAVRCVVSGVTEPSPILYSMFL